MAIERSQPLLTNDVPIELGRFLADTLGAVAAAQQQLDEATAQRVELYRQRAPAEFAVPPLWHVFNKVEVEIAMSAQISQVRSSSGVLEPRLFSRTVTPSSVALYGYQASAGLIVRVSMEPKVSAASDP